MSKRLHLVLLSVLLVPAMLLPGVALAQGEPEPEPEGGDEVELGDEGLADDEYTFGETSNGDLSGSDENPGDPNSAFSQDNADKPKVKASTVEAGYPSRVIDRPLTLPAGMSQLSLSSPSNVDPAAIAGSLTASYGITREAQVGLRYGLGRYQDEFAVGKAVAIDAQYLFTDEISAQLSVPLYLDPLAFGVVLGAPMRFTFFDSFSLFFGRDLVSLKLYEFFPSIDNATQNDANILVRQSNQITPLWIGRLALGANYQMSDQLAVEMELGTEFNDDQGQAATSLLNLGVLYANTNKLDFGARVGSRDLSSFSETLQLSLFANLRI